MGINVLIFADEIRPKENWQGLLRISIAAAIVDKVIVVSAIENDFFLTEKVTHKKVVNIREIPKHRLVFGLPAKYVYLKYFNIFSHKSIFLGVFPGKVTKAVGLHYHDVSDKLFKKILIFVKSLFPYNYTLTGDFEDAMYLATSFGQHIRCYLPIGLPKNFQIASEFLKDNGVRKRGILFVPTHRWDGRSSIITQWLGDENFLKALKKFNVYYNNHPNEEDNAVLHKSVINTKTLSNSVWRHVDILVTDYSSIAHDYLAAGGKNVVHITPDFEEFEDHEGKSPLSLEKQFPGVRLNTKNEFIDFLEKVKYFEKDLINVEEYSNSWIKRILSNN